MAMTHTPRTADEKALLMLAMREAGATLPAIAQACGTTPATVRNALYRIDKDYAESER